MKETAGFLRVPRLVQDIIDNAEAIFRYTEGMDLAAVRQNEKVQDAVERCLVRISEAVSRLGHMTPRMMPDQSWEEFTTLGDDLQHNYDSIDKDRLFNIVKNDLPSLYAAAEAALQSFPENDTQ